MRYIKLKVPVKTYIRKYIECKHPGEIHLSITHNLGKLLYACLEKQNSHWYKKPWGESQQRYNLLTDYITVLLPANGDTFYKTGFMIPPAKKTIVNDFFEDLLIQELNIYCNIMVSKTTQSRNQAIENFCEDYNIYLDVDITHAAIKKSEYRYRKNRESLHITKTKALSAA